MRTFWMALILSCLAAQVNAEIPAAWRVRSTDGYFQTLIMDGYSRSERFRSLVDRLNQSDVVVYVEAHRRTDARYNGYLLADVRVGGQNRYLRIRLKARGARDIMVAVVAHELQHALEVAEAPNVRDADTFHAHFQRIDNGTCSISCYETTAEEQTEAAVLRDLREGGRTPR